MCTAVTAVVICFTSRGFSCILSEALSLLLKSFANDPISWRTMGTECGFSAVLRRVWGMGHGCGVEGAVINVWLVEGALERPPDSQ